MYFFLLPLAFFANAASIETVIGTREVKDQCKLDSDCSFRGTCHPVPNILGTETNICHCPRGYTGPQCQYATCPGKNPCENDGICELVNTTETKYKCHCPLGFEGYQCELKVEKTACSNNPCVNGLCRLDGSIDKAVCDCFYHFTGPRCDQPTQCDWTSCSGHGTCSMKINKRLCTCDPGWKGDRCQYDIDECATLAKPCVAGICENTPGSYVCHCPSNRIGSRCEVVHDGDCNQNPCQNNGICRPEFNRLTNRGFTCTCATGFSGTLCEQKNYECAPYEDSITGRFFSRCDNGGVCIDAVGDYKCHCMPGHTGRDCHDTVNECALFGAGYCLNGGTCLDEYGKVKCACVIGFTGDRCEASVDDCVNNLCHSESKCIDGLRSYKCECPPHRMGIHCEFLNPCVDSPCEHGECAPLTHLGTYKCKCKPGYTGVNCTEDIDECSANPHICNRGTCVNLPGSFRCDCDPGIEGEFCDQFTDECADQPCLNGGTCLDHTADFECICMPGWMGKRCDEPKPYSPACTSLICFHGGVCQRNPIGVESCVCPPLFDGITCERPRINPCAANLCQNNGVCTPTNDYKSFTCACTPGFAGALCEDLVDSCDALPCVRGICLTLMAPNDAPFTCSCDPGYFGSRCERQISQCASNVDACGPGICIDGDNDFTCACPSTHVGPRCEMPVTNPCQLSPCLNDGVCLQVDIRGNFRCNCPPGFSGPICQFGSEVCSAASCLHGGICDASGGCECAPGYGGKHCERELNRCAREVCRHGGTCENVGDTGFTCHCAYGYAGAHCELKFDVDMFNETEKTESDHCEKNNCSLLSGNSVCDEICNLPGCDFDGGDCSSNIPRPLAVCPYEKYCKYVLNNGICDELCNNEACLFDGFDCVEKSATNCPDEKYCQDRYGDGICDPICNVAGCGWDGGDCSRSSEHKILVNSMKLILITDPDRFIEQAPKFLMVVSQSLHAAAQFQLDEAGHPMVYHWSEEAGEGALIELPEAVLTEFYRKKRETPSQKVGVVVYLILDVSVCHIAEPLLSQFGLQAVGIGSKPLMSADACFTDTTAAANLLAMESTRGVFDSLDMKIANAEAVVARKNVEKTEHSMFEYAVVGILTFCVCVFILVGTVNARKRSHPDMTYGTNVFDPKTNKLMFKKARIEASDENYGAPDPKRRFQPNYPSSNDLYDYDYIRPAPTRPVSTANFSDLHARVSRPDPLGVISPDEAQWVNIPDNDGQTCIHCAANSCSAKPDNFVIADIATLIAAGADVTAQNNNMETALHIAIKRKRINVALYLLDKIDVNVADIDGYTPLYIAVSMDFTDLIDAILEMNVNVNAVVKSNLTALIQCAKQGDRRISTVEKLLDYPGIDVNLAGDKTSEDYTGKTALHVAAENNSVGIMKLLLKSKANIAAMDCNYQTPLFYAVQNNKVEAVKLLLERMQLTSIEAGNAEDKTPLKLAKELGYDEIAALIEAKLSPNQPQVDYRQQNPTPPMQQQQMPQAMNQNQMPQAMTPQNQMLQAMTSRNQMPQAIMMPQNQMPQAMMSENQMPPLQPELTPAQFQMPSQSQQQYQPQPSTTMYPQVPLRNIDNISVNRECRNTVKSVKRRRSSIDQQPSPHGFNGNATQTNSSYSSDSAYFSSPSHYFNSSSSFSFDATGSSIPYDKASLTTIVPNPQYVNHNMPFTPMPAPTPGFANYNNGGYQQPTQQLPQFMQGTQNYQYNMAQMQLQQQMFAQMNYNAQINQNHRRSS